MGIRLRKPLPQKVIVLTEKYAKRYPGTWHSMPAPGRIFLKKRPEYNAKLATLMIRDKKLRSYLMDEKRPLEERVKLIADYVLRKEAGNKQKAREFLNKEIDRHQKIVDETDAFFEKLIGKKGLGSKQAEVYFKHARHMYVSFVVTIGGDLYYCLEKYFL